MPMSLRLALLVPLVLVAACSREAASPPAAPAPAPAEPAVAAAPAVSGEAVYAAHCASCHEGQAARAPHRTIAGLMAPHRIVTALESGVMMEQGKALSPEERRAVAEFLTGTPYSEPAPLPAALACATGTSNFDANATPDASGWGVDPGNGHLYPASVAGLDKSQVPALKLKWAFAFPDAIRARSQPVLGGGALYVGSHDGTVYALDQLSGCIRWSFKASAEVRNGPVLDTWERGDTNASPGLYFGDLNGHVYAVDARTGALRWRDRPDEHPSLTITASPVRFEDGVFFALSSLEVTAAANPDYACCTFRGGVVGYDAAERHEDARALGCAGVGNALAGRETPPPLHGHRRELLLPGG
jgi:polyvinyl alcohol dehydrogenase (cytochrome)